MEETDDSKLNEFQQQLLRDRMEAWGKWAADAFAKIPTVPQRLIVITEHDDGSLTWSVGTGYEQVMLANNELAAELLRYARIIQTGQY